MPFVVRFVPESMSSQQYDVAFGSLDALHVSDIWDTKENFDRFGQTLMPILQEAGVDPGTPQFIETHNIIAGK
jgi:hypothetical protein